MSSNKATVYKEYKGLETLTVSNEFFVKLENDKIIRFSVSGNKIYVHNINDVHIEPTNKHGLPGVEIY